MSAPGDGKSTPPPDPLDMHGACDEFGGEDYPSSPLVEPEPAPRPAESTPVWELVVADMLARDKFGHRKYGTRLRSGNGRDALKDAYQEALDLAVYLRQAIEERES